MVSDHNVLDTTARMDWEATSFEVRLIGLEEVVDLVDLSQLALSWWI